MKRPNNFALTKVKIIKNGGLDVTYRETKTDKGITDTIDINIKNTVNPHPDLVDKIGELKEYLTKCYGFDDVIKVAKSKGLQKGQMDAFKKVLETIENVHKEQMKKIAITSVSINGVVENDKDKRSVVISGTHLMENNSKTALNSPRIKLNTNQFKFEADVQDIINDLSEEVSLYLFDGKKAQLELFGENKKLNQDFIDGKISKIDEKGEVIEKKPSKKQEKKPEAA